MKAIRTLTYNGSQRWIEMCVRNSFISVLCSPTEGLTVESKWEDDDLQSLAVETPELNKNSQFKLSVGAIADFIQRRFGCDHGAAYKAAQLIHDSAAKGVEA